MAYRTVPVDRLSRSENESLRFSYDYLVLEQRVTRRARSPLLQHQTLINREPFLLENAPYFPRCHRHLDVAHSGMGQSINNRVDDGLWSANSRRFADSFRSD